MYADAVCGSTKREHKARPDKYMQVNLHIHITNVFSVMQSHFLHDILYLVYQILYYVTESRVMLPFHISLTVQ